MNPEPELRLADVVKASPLEDEAEYYLQKTLEEVLPQEVGDSIGLVDIPEDAEQEFFDRQKEVAKKDPAKLEEAQLWDLAAEMQKMQETSEVENDGFGLNDSIGDIDVVLTEADKLVENATNLVPPRIQATKPSENQTALSPKARWAQLKAATLTVGAVGKVRNDEEEAAETIDPVSNNDIENASFADGSSVSSDGIGNFLKVGATMKADLHDFDAWVRLRHRGALYYARVILLYVMIPSAGLAAVLFYLADNPPCGSTGDGCRSRTVNQSTGSESVDSVSTLSIYQT